MSERTEYQLVSDQKVKGFLLMFNYLNVRIQFYFFDERSLYQDFEHNQICDQIELLLHNDDDSNRIIIQSKLNRIKQIEQKDVNLQISKLALCYLFIKIMFMPDYVLACSINNVNETTVVNLTISQKAFNFMSENVIVTELQLVKYAIHKDFMKAKTQLIAQLLICSNPGLMNLLESNLINLLTKKKPARKNIELNENTDQNIGREDSTYENVIT